MTALVLALALALALASMNTRLSTSNKAIVADLLQSEHHITIKYVKTQYQKGYSDCGLFTIANAVAICNGLSPEYLKYDQNSMRGHLMQALQNKFLSPFPAGKADRKNVIQKEKIYVCGSCKMFEEEQMLECVKCENKFHLRCVADQTYFKEQEEWYCTSCSTTKYSYGQIAEEVKLLRVKAVVIIQ